MKQSLSIQDFSGGISPFDKVGIKGSARFIKTLNLHEDPSRVTLMPAPAKVSGSTVTALVKWGVDTNPYATDRYFYDASGNIYKETSGGTWSVDRAGATIANGAAGQGMEVFDNFVYYATSSTIGRKGYLNGTPAYADDFLSDGTTNIDQSLDTSGNTYTVPTAISETATNRQTFVPTRDPLKAIRILVAAKGTGDWTITLHDAANNSLGSVTVASASITGSTDNTFTFSTPIRLTIGNTYHFHVTVSTGVSTVTTTTASDLETVDFATFFGILIADTDFHPMLEHLNFLCVGNANYLAKWDRATYNPNVITFKPGFKVRTLTKWREYIAIGCVPANSSDNLNLCRIYYWDGIKTTFNFFDDVPFGFINALHNQQNKLMGIYGNDGSLFLGNAPFQEVQGVPKLARGKEVTVYPGAVTSWQNRTYIGYAGATDDGTGMEQGVYEYGSKSDQFPDVLSYAFVPTVGTNKSTTTKVGFVKGLGKDLYIGYAYSDGTFGVEKVIRTNNAVSTGSWESLIFDNEQVQHTKLAIKLVITFQTLTTGQSITPKYKINRATDWTLGTAVTSSSTDPTRAEIRIEKRFKEIEFGYDVASSSNTYVVPTGVLFTFDDNPGEAIET